MPVHWFYSPTDIDRRYGRVTDFHRAPDVHPSSIMSLSNTGGAGRGGQKGTIIGDVINHGKAQYWGKQGVHYHRGMAAGENTLNALVARLLVRTVVAEQGWAPASFLREYVRFMTTRGSHNDTYAESYHRMFFANWARGTPPEQCADDDGHNIASAGGLVLLPPVAILAAASAGGAREPAAAAAAAADAAVRQMYLTHRSEELAAAARVYARLLAALLCGTPLRDAAAAAGRALGLDLPALAARGLDDRAVIGHGTFSSACYIAHSLPALLYLAFKHADDPEAALIANTNVGGENCHRGAALGAVMGAAHGKAALPLRWRTGLAAAPEIAAEAAGFGALVAARAGAEQRAA